MSYEPTNWKSGDVISSQKLNKLEQGMAGAGGGGSLIVPLTVGEDPVLTATKTCKEIYDASFCWVGSCNC